MRRAACMLLAAGLVLIGVGSTALTAEESPAIEPHAQPARYFVFLYGHGPTWPTDPGVEPSPFQGHFDYMGELTEQEVLVLGGPFTDVGGAMGVIRAAGLEQAREIIERDPGVRDGLFAAEVRPWAAWVPGCVGVRQE